MTFCRNSAVFLPGRMPGTKEPYSFMFLDISTGLNISDVQKKEKKKIRAMLKRRCTTRRPAGMALHSAFQPERLADQLREGEQGRGEDDRHHAGLVHLERQEVALAAVDARPRVSLAYWTGSSAALRDEDDDRRRSAGRAPAGRRAGTRPLVWAMRSTTASGTRAMMPAMMSSEMPLPTPCSVICSPTHMSRTRAGGQGEDGAQRHRRSRRAASPRPGSIRPGFV